jgi:hypothetical protein
MNLRIIFAFFFIFLVTTVQSRNLVENFDKAAYYAILKSGKIDKVDDELTLLTSTTIVEKEAYEGTLLMKKAALIKIPAERLKTFKKGRTKLETALLNDGSNGEYHFLRLVIQENAPKIVKYSADIETDKQDIQRSFKSLSPVVQGVILDYCKSSKILHAQDF